MKLQYITLLLLVTVSYIAKAQNDTLYFDEGWIETTNENASFYRPPLQKEGEFYKMKDYYIDGTLQMSGTSTFKDSVHLQGKAVWYNRHGAVDQEETYQDNTLNGVATYYRENSPNLSSEVIYDMGQIVSEVRFDKKRDGIRYKRYFNGANLVKTEYYGNEGELISTYYTSDDDQPVGTKVTYYNSPMRVKSIEVYEDGLQVYSNLFYRNGQKQVEFDTIQLRDTFYNQKGKQIGVMQYEGEVGELYYYNGQEYDFYSDGTILTINTFEEGKQTNRKQYNPSGILVREGFYKDNQLVKTVNYNEQGDKLYEFENKNGVANGIIRSEYNVVFTYKDNILQKLTLPYRLSNKTFMSFEDSVHTFYDIKGQKLGSLKVKIKPGELRYQSLKSGFPPSRPIEGTDFQKNYEDQISHKTVYKDSKKISETQYFYYQEKAYSETHFYNENNDITKTINCFSNGEIQSIIHYIIGTTGIAKMAHFFDKTGSKIGQYNYLKKTGTLYQYFPHSDDIKSVVQKKNDRLLKKKIYERFYDNQLKKNVVALREDIDFMGDAKFYSREGDLIAEAIYKNGEPTGTLYSSEWNSFTDYKNGEKHGKYISYESDEKTVQNQGYYKNDEKHGTFTYSTYGIKQKVENYKEGQKEGYTIYYDKEGNEVSRLMYKNGEPYEGKSYDRTYDLFKVYKKGSVTKRIYERRNFSIEITYPSETQSNTTVFSTNGEKLLSYTQLEDQLQGKLIYYKNNESEHTAVFENGYLIKGAVWISSNSQRRKADYAKLSRKNNTVSLETYNKEDQLTATDSIVMDKDTHDSVLILGRSLNVSPEKLFLKEYGLNVF